MAKLEDLKPGVAVKAIVLDRAMAIDINSYSFWADARVRDAEQETISAYSAEIHHALSEIINPLGDDVPKRLPTCQVRDSLKESVEKRLEHGD